MNHAIFMGVFEGRGELLCERESFGERDGAFGNPVGQRGAGNQFEDQGALFHAVDCADVRVIESGEDLCLASEARQAVRVLGEGIGQYFDGDVAVKFGVAGAVDGAHAAFADLGGDTVVGDLLLGAHENGAICIVPFCGLEAGIRRMRASDVPGNDTIANTCSMSAPSQIAHYKITGKLGEGGMGAVYRATDTKLNRDVAIKVLPATFAQDGDRLARFSREAHVLAALNHPNIASIYGIEDGALVMELVEGDELSGPLPLDTALAYAKQIAAALEAAHEKGIIHRDLKPANIKVTPDGTVKVLDFGLAKAAEMTAASAAAANPTISPTLSLAMTQAGGILGTAAYMSPEQARGKAVDKRTDIWAFGVVLYEMLSGRPLFADETVTDTLAHVLTRTIDVTAMPLAVRPLLARCLERDPKKRLRDIGDAWYLLADAGPAPAAAPRRPWPWIAAGVFALLAAILLMLWIMRVPSAAPLSHRYTVEEGAGLSLSPDGRWLLSSSRGELRLRAHDGVEWRTLPGTEGADYPFWSPDSSAVGFFAGGRLRRISVQGTELRNLAAASNPHGGTWHGGVNNGSLLFTSEGRLQSLELATGQVRAPPIQYPAGTVAELPAFLPESDRFLFVLGNDQGAALYRSSLSAAPGPAEKFLESPHQVNFARHPRSGAWHIFFSLGSGDEGFSLLTCAIDPRTGDLKGVPEKIVSNLATVAGRKVLNFGAADGGMMIWRRSSASLPVWRLRWFDRSGNILSTVGDPGTYTGLALSPDETQLAVTQGYPTSDIWLYVWGKGGGSRLSTEAGSKRGSNLVRRR